MGHSAAPPSKTLSVVVADDTPGIRLLMRHILEGSGAFQVVAEAADGQEAVDLATALQPDLVLLDLLMPKLDGLEAIPRIRSSSPGSRIVVLSGVTRGLAPPVSGGGPDGYVEKRQRPEEILRIALDVCRSAPRRPAAVAEPDAEPPSEPGPQEPASTPAGPDEASALRDELARVRADLARVGSAASHDLKSPLQAVLGFAHLLDQLYPDLDERARTFLSTIIEATDRMGLLVNGLAVYCRTVSRQPELVPVELDTVLAGVLQELDGEIVSRGASVTSRPLPAVAGDPAGLAVVLTNLLANALASVGPDTPPRIEVSAEPTPAGWSIAVQDNGAGVDPEHHDNVFGLFVRLPSGPGPPGAGVGLALCKRLVEDWGGRIWVEQPPGALATGGSRFCFTVPTGRGPADRLGAAPAAPPDETSPGGTALDDGLPAAIPGAAVPGAAVPQLLLVEDSEPHARLVAAALTEAPGPRYRIRHVPDLRHARMALAGQQVDCILLDLSLPDGEGLDSLSQMRALAPSVPVVVLTSREDESLAVRAVQHGAQDYLVKGAMEPRLLSRSIRYAIERKALEAQLAQQALRDSLTGLPNRTLLLDRLNPALARAALSREKVALLYLDLDGFKPVNDELGHEAGDGILVEVARRLTSVVRPHDTVARIGGDEFAVLCEGFHADGEIRALAARMADAIAEPVPVGAGHRSVRASIGIAFAGGLGESADDLIRIADQAMYRDKRRG